MRIKTSITVIIFTTIFLVITSLGVTWFYSSKTDRATEAGRLADGLADAVSKLKFLTYEFQQYPSLRVQDQWEGIYQKVGQQLEFAQRLRHEYAIVGHIPVHYRALRVLFNKLLEASQASKSSPKNTILVELRTRLTDLMFLELQEIISHINELSSDIRTAEAKLAEQAKVLNLSCWSILFLMVVVNAFILRRKILRPLSRLEQGVAIIGAGNLDHRVGTAAPGEVGDLSRAFDAMAANLQEKAASLEWEAAANAALAEAARRYLEQESERNFLDDFSHLILEQARSLTGSELGYVGYLDQATGSLICPTLTRDVWKTCQVADKKMIFQEFRGLWGWSLENRQAVLTNHPDADPRAAGTPAGHLAINRFLTVPALLGDRLMGQVALANAPRDYTPRDQVVIQRLADLYAMTVQRHRTEAELRLHREHLEDLVSTRTIELQAANDRLQQEILVRRQAEVELRQEKTFSDTAIASQPGIFYLFNAHGDFHRWNENLESITGYSHEEVSRMQPLDFFWPEDKPRVQEVIAEVFAAGAATVEAHLLGKDGVKIPYLFTGRQIMINGEPCVIGMGLDISARQQAEARLMMQSRIADIFLTVSDDEMFNEVLKVVLEAMSSELGVFGYLDANGALVVPSMTRQVWDRCQVAAKTITFPREAWGDSSWPRAIREKRIISSNEASTLVPEGHVGIGRHISLPLLYQGEAIGLLQVANKETGYTDADIHTLETMASHIAPILSARLQRQRAQEALRAGERFLASIFSSILDGICVLDTDMNILRVNATMEKWYAHALPLVGRKCYEVYHGRSAPCEQCPSIQTLRTGQAAYEVSPLRDEKGEIIGWFDLYSFPLVDADTGQITGVIEYVRDISARKQAEDELQKTLVDLERSNKELEQFAYVASHDLQEPLRMVSSYTQLLARRYHGKLDADADDFINYAVDGAERMQRLINDLLTFSRVGTRGKPFAPTDCEVLLTQTLDNLKMTIQETGAVITHEPLPPIIADDTQMAQLFQNLIGNALKFRRKSLPHIHLKAEFQGKEWLFSVRDNGIGIPPEFFDRIFIIFQRLHGREDYTGTGIGLAICKRIVERHGGRIWVESQVGEGSTFYFTIPVKRGKTV
jgi:PAS domain S-box-containing protein